MEDEEVVVFALFGACLDLREAGARKETCNSTHTKN